MARTLGAKNKIGADVREMVRLALDRKGGIDYLTGIEDKLFVTLLREIVPREVHQVSQGNVLVVNVQSNVEVPKIEEHPLDVVVKLPKNPSSNLIGPGEESKVQNKEINSSANVKQIRKK